jgi:hypothetical protein
VRFSFEAKTGLIILEIAALGQQHTDLPVLAHTLPPTSGVDGLLGLDFLRRCRIVIDFRRGQIVLT